MQTDAGHHTSELRLVAMALSDTPLRTGRRTRKHLRNRSVAEQLRGLEMLRTTGCSFAGDESEYVRDGQRDADVPRLE